jgi:epoxyqueuosine reductase QueG
VITCRCEALVLVEDIITVVETEECGYCTECEAVCPTGAIRCPYEIVIEEYYEES